MGLVPTAVLAGLALTLVIVFGWMGARPASPVRGPRLIPWRFLMLIAAVALLLALEHLAGLAGFAASSVT